MKLLIVDDHVMFREGLAALLGAQPDIHIVGEAGSNQEAIQMARETKPDIVLMDFSLPDGDGVDGTRAILAENPDTKVLFLTIHSTDERLFEALRAGAKGYLLKNLPTSKLVASLRAVENCQAALSREMTLKVIEKFSKTTDNQQSDQSHISLLTSRELNILQELSTFASNAEIAERLSLSENTVKNHVHTILKKLEIKNRREAAWFAQEQKLGKSGGILH